MAVINSCGQIVAQDVILQNDIEHPDFTGWLYDLGSKERRWCVLADMLLCVFVKKEDVIPAKVILVSGSRIIRVLCNTAKHNALDPLKLVGMNFAGQSPDITVSGLLKYSFIVEDCFKKTECTFATDSEALLDRWILMLRLASNLDVDVFCDILNAEVSPGLNRCPSQNADVAHKFCSASTTCVNSFPKYIPTMEYRKHRLYCSDSTVKHVSEDSQMNEKPMFSKVNRPNTDNLCDGFSEDKIDVIDAVNIMDDSNIVTSVKRSSSLKRQSSFELFKDLLQKKTQVHSMRSKVKDVDSITYQERISDRPEWSMSDVQPADDMLSMSLPSSFSHQSRMCSYTTSVDSSSNPVSSFAQRIASKALNIRDKFKDRRKKQNSVEDVEEQTVGQCCISGELLYKQMLRWSRVWCVVSEGCLNVFRRQEDRMPMSTIVLVDCSVSAVRHDKFTRQHVFRVCQLSARSLYFQTGESNFQRWLQILKEETNTYESFQPSTPLYPELFDENIQDNCNKQHDESVSHDGGASVCSPDVNVPSNKNTLGDRRTRSFEDAKTPSKLNISQSQSTYTCWTLDNYFEQHYLNKQDFSASCESFDSWSSQSMLADDDIFYPDVSDNHLCELSSSHKNGIFQFLPRLSSSMSLVGSKGEMSLSSGEETIFNRHLPGPNNEGLLLVVDDFPISPNHVKLSAAEKAHDRCPVENTHQVAASDSIPKVNCGLI